MKSIISKAMALVVIAATLLSFSPKLPQGSGSGGEGFEISLNGKIVIERYGPNLNDLGSLQLNQSSPNDKITIKYHHCGKVGKNRVVTIRDGQDKIVKEWRFNDTDETVAVMTCNVKDILNLKNAGNGTLKLFYSSTELPKGRVLASIVVGNNNVAKG